MKRTVYYVFRHVVMVRHLMSIRHTSHFRFRSHDHMNLWVKTAAVQGLQDVVECKLQVVLWVELVVGCGHFDVCLCKQCVRRHFLVEKCST